MDSKPWWWPERVDEKYAERLRKDYGHDDWPDQKLFDRYDVVEGTFEDCWDHLGDARSEYYELAEAFLQLVEETNKKPEDFK